MSVPRDDARGDLRWDLRQRFDGLLDSDAGGDEGAVPTTSFWSLTLSSDRRIRPVSRGNSISFPVGSNPGFWPLKAPR